MPNPTNLGPHALDWDSGHLAGWTYNGEVKKWFQGSFRNLHAVSRPCPVCGDDIKIDVTSQALTGFATNHGLALRRCKTCRAALKTGADAYAARKRPAAPSSSVAPAAISTEELEELRMANKIMKEELSGLYARRNELIAEVEELKKLLAPENKMPWGS